jgi:hypothetical protein
MTFITITNDQLKILKQEIQDNIEWLETTDFSLEVECIAIENLEVILSTFLKRKIKLTLE